MSNKTEVAEIFASYFSSVYDNNSTLNVEELFYEFNQTQSNILTIDFIDVSNIDLFLNTMISKNSAGPDKIAAYIYKACRDELKYPLTLLFNLSLKTNFFPDI